MTPEERLALARIIGTFNTNISMLRGEVDVLRGVVLALTQANSPEQADQLTRAHVEAARVFSLFESGNEDRQATVDVVSSMVLDAITKGRGVAGAARSHQELTNQP